MSKKTQKYGAALMAATLAVSSASVQVIAMEQSVETSTLEQKVETSLPPLNYESEQTASNNEDLFKKYIDQLFYGKQSTSLFANFGETRLSGVDKKYYEVLRNKIREVASGTSDSTTFTIKVEELGLTSSYSAADLGVDALVDASNNVTEQAKQAMTSKLLGNRKLILNCLLTDCPYELYWFDKTKGTDYTFYNPMIVKENGELRLKHYGDVTIKMNVVPAYQKNNDPLHVDTTKAQQARTAANNAKAIVERVKNDASIKTDYDKMVAFKEEICKLVDYNYDALNSNTTYGDPWQLVYVFDHDPNSKVVCEGYSKAFQYLCDLAGLDCYTVTGIMQGGTGAGRHMWNIVTLGGKHYMVDVTNSDTGTAGQDGSLFVTPYDKKEVNLQYPVQPPTPQNTFKYTYGTVEYYYDPSELVMHQTDANCSNTQSVLYLSDQEYQAPQEREELIMNLEHTEYGTEYNPTFTGDYDPNETIKILYKKASDGEESYTSKKPRDVGSYNVKAIFSETEQYLAKTITANFEITPKALLAHNVEVEQGTFVYNGSMITPNVTVTDGTNALVEGKDYTKQYQDNVNAGTARVVVTGTGNYKGSIRKTFTIDQATGNGTLVLDDYVYGTNKEPKVTSSTHDTGKVTYQYKQKNASDETYTTTKPTKAGTYIVKAIFASTQNYASFVLFDEFTITKAQSSFDVASISNKTYGDANFKVMVSNKVGEANLSYSSNNEEVATVNKAGTVTIKGVGEVSITISMNESENYLPTSKTVTFTVHKAEGSGSVLINDVIYGDSVNPTAQSTTNNPNTVEYFYKLATEADQAYTTTKPEVVGNYVVKAVFKENANYKTYQVIKEFKILPKTMTSLNVILEQEEFEFTANPITPNVVIKDGTKTLIKEKDYTLTYKNNTNVGVAEITINGKGNYSGTIKKTFTIIDRNVNVETLPTLTGVYGTKVSDLSVSGGVVKDKGTGALVEGTWRVKEQQNDIPSVGTNANYIVVFTPTDTNRYHSVEVQVTPTISKKAITVTVNNKERVYKQTNPSFDVTVSEGTLVDKDTIADLALTYTTTATKESDVGTYDINATSASNNYEVTIHKGTLTITKAQGSASVQLQGWTYGQEANTPVVQSTTNDPTNVVVEYKVKGAADSTYTTTLPTNAADYVVRVTLASNKNYEQVQATTSFAIAKAQGSASVQLQGWTYGQEANTPVVQSTTNDPTNVVVEYKVKGAADSTYTTTLPTNANDYVVRVTLASNKNYEQVQATTNVTIQAKALNEAMVTLPQKQFDHTGNEIRPNVIVNDQEVTLTNKDYEVQYENNVNLGTGTVKVIGKGNYSGTITKTFIIIDRNVNVETLPTLTGVYGTKVSDLSVSGGVVKDKGTGALVSGTWRVKEQQNDIPSVGTNANYIVVFTPTDTNRYHSVEVQVIPTISKKAITVTVNNKERVYKQTNPSFDVTVSEGTLVNKDTIADLALTYTTTATKESDVGTYDINATSASNNYEVTIHKGTLTITKAQGSASVQLQGWTYGQEANTPVVQSTTNDPTNVVVEYKVKGAADSTYTTTLPTNAADYEVRVTLASNKNYEQVQATTSFAIAKAQGSASVQLQGWTYGQKANTPVIQSTTNDPTNVVVEYKVKGAADSTYTTTLPTNAADYVVRVTLVSNKNYEQVQATTSFAIAKAQGSASVQLQGWTYGQKANTPVVQSTTNDIHAVTYFYKAKGASDDTFTTKVPTKAGTYVVKVQLKETLNYQSVLAESEFVISKALRPEQPSQTERYVYEQISSLDELTPIEGWSFVESHSQKYELGGVYDVTIESMDLENYEEATTTTIRLYMIPKVIKADCMYQLGVDDTFVVSTNGSSKMLQSVMVDGKSVDANVYSYVLDNDGNSVYSFPSNFMHNLAKGSHSIQFIYKSKTVTHTFTVSDSQAMMALQEELKHVEAELAKLNEKEYTEDSINALKNAIANAKSVLSNPNASDALVNEQIKLVQNAWKQLRKAIVSQPSLPKPEDTNKEESNAGDSSDKDSTNTADVTNMMASLGMMIASAFAFVVAKVGKKHRKQ